jgi:hypothetical protein
LFRKLNAGDGGAPTKATNMKLDKILEKLRWRAATQARDLIFIHMRTINVCGIKGEWNNFTTLVRCNDTSKVWFELPKKAESYWQNPDKKKKINTSALYADIEIEREKLCQK